jgi:hypothetical protein
MNENSSIYSYLELYKGPLDSSLHRIEYVVSNSAKCPLTRLLIKMSIAQE